MKISVYSINKVTILQKMRNCITFLFVFGFISLLSQKEYTYADIEKKAAFIEVLNISNEGLIDLPPAIKECKKLKKLLLKNNRITFLPSWFKELENLEELDISGNRTLNINQAFSLISKLPKLKILTANHCNMFYLPVAIRRIKTLKEVNISDNHIKYLPPIFEYTHWEKLDLSYNCIDTLPGTLVFMNSLRELNLSYTPSIANKFTYYTIEFLKKLTTLKLSGADHFPPEINKLNFLKNLILTNGTFNSLPEEFKQLSNLSALDVRGCENFKISSLVEGLIGSYNTLKELKIGHKNLTTIPFNISKLKKIERLIIDHSCLEKLSSSFAKFKGHSVHFRGCSFSNPSMVFNEIGKNKKVKKLYINNCVFGRSDWKIGGSKTLEEIHITHCGLVYIPLNTNHFPELNLLNLKGNKIAKNKINWKIPKTILGADYQSISYGTDEFNNWNYTQNQKTIKRMIYTEIGDLFTLPSGAKVEIQPDCFIGTGNKSIQGDVKLEIKEFTQPKDFALTNYPSFLPSSEVSDAKYAIELRAYSGQKEVFIKSEKPIHIYPKFTKNYALEKYYFLNYKSEWQNLNQKTNVCIKNTEAQVVPKCDNYSDMPRISQDLKISKVFIKLQRKKKKNKLNFEITPEYGYREQLFNPFGDRIKGYPELKHYKEIKWRYEGDSMETDLRKLYFLSDESKEDKLKRYNSLKAYVLDIKDIRVFPNPKDDNYLIQFIQGRDTFSIEALPFLSVYKAKKIQRWHKIKYKRYKKALLKRKEKWLKLDTNYINRYENFEIQLEAYRLHNLRALYSVRHEDKSDDSAELLKIYKPGLYQMAIPLLINNGQAKKPIYYINSKRFHPQRVLVSNLSKKYHFWTNAKEPIPKESGAYQISIVLNGTLYTGKWGNTNKVNFEKSTIK